MTCKNTSEESWKIKTKPSYNKIISMVRYKQTISNMMYQIKINKEVVAVSENILTAMANVRKLVADRVGIRNENAIEFKTHGVEYLPWSDSATAVLEYNDELFIIFITSIKLL